MFLKLFFSQYDIPKLYIKCTEDSVQAWMDFCRILHSHLFQSRSEILLIRFSFQFCWEMKCFSEMDRNESGFCALCKKNIP
jgi:hypothetical protein